MPKLSKKQKAELLRRNAAALGTDRCPYCGCLGLELLDRDGLECTVLYEEVYWSDSLLAYRHRYPIGPGGELAEVDGNFYVNVCHKCLGEIVTEAEYRRWRPLIPPGARRTTE